MKNKRHRLKQAERWLRSHFPPPIRTMVRVERLKDCHGDCGPSRGGLVVRVSKDLGWHHAIDVLIHEWAHAYRWGRENKDHDRAWSDAYGRIYREWFHRGGAEESRGL